ncbi:MAG: helix-turn-helix transcriptional regulator [Oscillospiraceae bacterium]|nr:helix-turn-helix transcriptional regulator [Oscillospiraceae bacterium]
MTIGDKILNLRKARGWSQEEMADRVGVSRQAVSRWEAGSAKPDADKIVDICDLFGVSADYLLRDRYAGEGELGNSDSAPASVPEAVRPLVTPWQILGILMIVLGILTFFALGIMSAIAPHVYCVDGVEFRGVLGYIMGNHLWWLVNTDFAVIALGVLLLVGPDILKKTQEFFRKDTPA